MICVILGCPRLVNWKGGLCQRLLKVNTYISPLNKDISGNMTSCLSLVAVVHSLELYMLTNVYRSIVLGRTCTNAYKLSVSRSHA